MTNQKAVAKARKLLMPVAASLAKRCPAGMSKARTDLALAHVTDSITRLSVAVLIFEEAEGRRAPEKIEECGA